MGLPNGADHTTCGESPVGYARTRKAGENVAGGAKLDRKLGISEIRVNERSQVEIRASAPFSVDIPEP
jgi:hypothetical protein